MRRWIAVGLFALSSALLVGCDCGQPTVTIRWVTESEFNTAGFNLYRAEREEGPYDVKVNDRLIPARDDPALGGEYIYTDTQVIAGRTYYYRLEEIEKDGTVRTLRTTKVEVGSGCSLGP